MFNSPAELAVALEEGRKFKTKDGVILSYDSSYLAPFRFCSRLETITVAMKGAWNQYDKVAEIEKEVDWDKVPRLTPVLVKDYKESDWESGEFVIKLGKNDFIYHVLTNTKYLTKWQYCKLDPDYPVKEEWYK